MRYLRKKDGSQYVWTAALAKRGDMEEVEEETKSQDPVAEVTGQDQVVAEAPSQDQEPETSAQAEPDSNTSFTAVELEALAWQHVKALVLKRGGEWTNKAEGIIFLTKAE